MEKNFKAIMFLIFEIYTSHLQVLYISSVTWMISYKTNLLEAFTTQWLVWLSFMYFDTQYITVKNEVCIPHQMVC